MLSLKHHPRENLVEVKREEALSTGAREVPQQGRHEPNSVRWCGALAELVDQEEGPRVATSNHVCYLCSRVVGDKSEQKSE